MFKPKKLEDSKQMYKQHLLHGDVLKIDGGAYDQIDLIPRNQINNRNVNMNVGCGNFQRLSRHDDAFYSAIDELKAEGYIVKRLSCEYSGCSQYSAYIYFLVGEDD